MHLTGNVLGQCWWDLALPILNGWQLMGIHPRKLAESGYCPFSFLFWGRGGFFGIKIIVHLPVAKFWAALIIGVHWLPRQVWSFAPTLIANVLPVFRAWVQDGFLPCWQSTFSRLQMDTSGRQRNSTPPGPDQICTSILCPQHGKKST